mmetsp:Transcript_7185/g.18742  ORF Transcript_7185/g.18742 Transcript_7185/m.18742 type:complete len:226 (-) Transcript_7185:1972-2649(-)
MCGQRAPPAERRASRMSGTPCARPVAMSASCSCASAMTRESRTTLCAGWAASKACTTRASQLCSSPALSTPVKRVTTRRSMQAWSSSTRPYRRSCMERLSVRLTRSSVVRCRPSCCVPSSISCSRRLRGRMPAASHTVTSRRTVCSQRRSTRPRTSTSSSSVISVSRRRLPRSAMRSCPSDQAAPRPSSMPTTSTSDMAPPTTCGRSALASLRWRAATATRLCTS